MNCMEERPFGVILGPFGFEQTLHNVRQQLATVAAMVRKLRRVHAKSTTRFELTKYPNESRNRSYVDPFLRAPSWARVATTVQRELRQPAGPIRPRTEGPKSSVLGLAPPKK